MQKSPGTYENYLTTHLSLTTNASLTKNKKQRIKHNYMRFMPVNKDAKMLDIGPGYGELLELLIQDLGYENSSGLDISSEVIDVCNSKIPGSGILVENTASFLNENSNSFDCIFMMHVLEHISKDNTHNVLKSIHNALRPDGTVIIEVPNMSNPITGLNIRYADFTHEVGFTDISLKSVLRQSGFSDISIHPLRVPIVSPQRLIQSSLQMIINNFFYVVSKIYIPSNNYIFSPSIYAIAKK
jgi:cyclopropane fatty-acyl-phospholipid synthase-like methyltransferase